MEKRLLCLALILAVLLPITACGDATQSEAPAEKQTLSISICWNLFRVERALEKFRELHPEVELVVHYYSNDWRSYPQKMATQLMAGKADDILDGTGLADVKKFESGLFADFYPLMANDPTFNEDDYYVDVIKAADYRGKLMQFPTSFVYFTMGVNNVFSPELTERYSEYETITWRQLIDFYNSVGDKGGRYAAYAVNAYTVVFNDMAAYIDFENKTCNFNNPEFIQLLTDWKQATSPQTQKSLWHLPDTDFFPATQEAFAGQYLFQLGYNSQTGFPAFFPYVDKQAFTHYIPVVSEEGNLMVELGDTFIISETCQNKELAWELIKSFTLPVGPILPVAMPVRKETFQIMVPDLLAEIIGFMKANVALDGNTEEITAQVMDLFERHLDRPMEDMRPLSSGVYEVILEAMETFYSGVMTAEQAASELQNKISLYLME